MPDPLFTEAQIKDDGAAAVGRTGLQVGFGAAIVTIVLAALKGRGYLHAGPDGSLLDNTLKDAYDLVVTMGITYAMNWRKLRGKT